MQKPYLLKKRIKHIIENDNNKKFQIKKEAMKKNAIKAFINVIFCQNKKD